MVKLGYISNKKFFLILLGYGLTMSLILGYAEWHDANLFRQSLLIEGVRSSEPSYIQAFIRYFLVYFVRLLVLCIPLLFKNKRLEIVTKYGLYFAVVFELIILIAALNIASTELAGCESSGPYSNCGFGFLLNFPIVLSIVAQIIGMIVGLIVAANKKKNQNT